MNRFPIVVEWDRGHVAAVVTVPDGRPEGVVVALSAIGRTNLIGSTICAHLSESLAERGLASVRLDYAGLGDSPGLVPSWTPSDVEDALRQTRAVLAASADVAGVTRFAAVGTCYGARIALSLVPDPECVGAICLAPPILDYGGFSRVSRSVGERGAFSDFRSSPLVRRLAGPLRRTAGARRPAPQLVAAFDHLGRSRIAFLYGKDPAEDHYSQQAQDVLDEALASLPADRRDRFELRMLPWGPLTTFDILSPADKEAVLDVVVPLVCASFDESHAPATAGVS